MSEIGAVQIGLTLRNCLPSFRRFAHWHMGGGWFIGSTYFKAILEPNAIDPIWNLGITIQDAIVPRLADRDCTHYSVRVLLGRTLDEVLGGRAWTAFLGEGQNKARHFACVRCRSPHPSGLQSIKVHIESGRLRQQNHPIPAASHPASSVSRLAAPRQNRLATSRSQTACKKPLCHSPLALR